MLAPAALPHFFRPLPSSLHHRPSPSPFPTPIPSPLAGSPTLIIHRPPVAAARAYAGHAERQLRSSAEGSGSGEGDDAYQKTLRLVECAMFASVSGLAYFLSNSLSIENYFGPFFPLPIVISSMRWGVAAGRKTMVATAILLLTLAGPVKALTYLLMHGIVGFVMGSLWRLEIGWALSIFLTTILCYSAKRFNMILLDVFYNFVGLFYGIVGLYLYQARAVGACGYVLVSSFLIRENILSLITINIHASVTYVLQALGVSTVPTMQAIYIIFGVLLFLNCGFLVFLLHILHAIILTKLGLRGSLRLPSWMNKAI